jgi:rod shape determining protein RodA
MSIGDLRSLRDLDWLMVLIALALCALGVLQIFSATQDSKFLNVWWRQIIYIAAGLILMWLVCSVDYHTWLGQAPWLYGAAVLLLLVAAAVGTKLFGSRRWIPLLFGFSFQVSEFAKVVIVLLVTRYLTGLRRDRLQAADIVKLGALVAVPCLLVAAQPDLGTALTYLPIMAVGMFIAGLQPKHVAVLALIGVAVPLVSYQFVLKDYQKKRVLAFLDPEYDKKGSGYQVIQSQIAIGSGQMWGRGVTHGTQTRLRFLPVSHADFIFATYSEEQGYVGVVFALGLYMLLLLQIVQNAQSAPDRAGMYICMGVAALFLFHLLVNVGMVAGMMPVTGIPLPLMSAGGSSTLTTFMLLGLVNNVRLRRFIS